MPGFGTILAGRKVGYLQIVVTAAGFALTLIGGVPAIKWGFAHMANMSDAEDPTENLRQLWIHMRWPLVGIALFVFAILWALTSSLSILAEARKAEVMRPLPPKINPGA
jgi:hypothetical protein